MRRTGASMDAGTGRSRGTSSSATLRGNSRRRSSPRPNSFRRSPARFGSSVRSTPQKRRLRFVLLQELERFLELFHGGVEGRRQEIDRQHPSAAAVRSAPPFSDRCGAGAENRADADVVFAVLVALDGAEVLVGAGSVLAVHGVPQFAVHRNDAEGRLGCRARTFSARRGQDFEPARLGSLRRHINAPQDGGCARAAKTPQAGEALACRSRPAGFGAGSTDVEYSSRVRDAGARGRRDIL